MIDHGCVVVVLITLLAIIKRLMKSLIVVEMELGNTERGNMLDFEKIFI